MGTLAERGGEPPTPIQTGGKVEVAVSPWKILFICEPGLCCGPCLFSAPRGRLLARMVVGLDLGAGEDSRRPLHGGKEGGR